VPILIGLAQIREIRHVLEFGCGRYSTLTFLNRAAFPDLERLQSVENDDSWAATIGKAAGDDKRWTLTHVEGEIADSITDLNLEAFDLILVDDSMTAAQRAATISTIRSKNPQHPWIVIHDYEVDEYRRAASGFRQKYSFKAFNPWTGLIWNSVTELRRVKALDRILKNHGKLLEPDDAEAWINAFSATEGHE